MKDDHSGYLQSDAYSGYDAIHARGIVEVGCWSHAWRKFSDARTSDPERAHAALAWIGRLYEVERHAREQKLDVATRHVLRQQRSRPVLTTFEAWLAAEMPKVLPKSPIGEAIAYARSNQTALSRDLEADFLSIDNNASENAIRPIALGRKNWLFCGSDRGGRTAATMLSLTASCNAFHVDPFASVRDLLNRVSTHPHSRIDELLPDRWAKPEATTPAGRNGS